MFPNLSIVNFKLSKLCAAWSAIGKRVEKPLLIKLCELRGVDKKFYNAENFVRDNTKKFDREIDFKLCGEGDEEYFCEVKLMGGGNPESANAVIARNSKIFVVDILSRQNKNQLDSLGIYWLEMKKSQSRRYFESVQKNFKKFKHTVHKIKKIKTSADCRSFFVKIFCRDWNIFAKIYLQLYKKIIFYRRRK